MLLLGPEQIPQHISFMRHKTQKRPVKGQRVADQGCSDSFPAVRDPASSELCMAPLASRPIMAATAAAITSTFQTDRKKKYTLLQSLARRINQNLHIGQNLLIWPYLEARYVENRVSRLDSLLLQI